MSDTPTPTTTASEMATNPSPPPVTKPASKMTPSMDRVDADDELVTAGSGSPVPAKKIRLISQTGSPQSKDVDSEGGSDQFHLLMDPKSIVGDIDLRQVVLNPAVWELLTPEERRDIVGLWPDPDEVDEAQAMPRFDSLRSNDHFRASISEYQRHLKNGQHEPEWITQAQDAHAKRACGFYDDMLAAEFKDSWGVCKLGQEEEEANGVEDTSGSPQQE